MIDRLKRIYAILYRIRCTVAKYRAFMNDEQAKDFADVDRDLNELHALIHGGKDEHKNQ